MPEPRELNPFSISDNRQQETRLPGDFSISIEPADEPSVVKPDPKGLFAPEPASSSKYQPVEVPLPEGTVLPVFIIPGDKMPIEPLIPAQEELPFNSPPATLPPTRPGETIVATPGTPTTQTLTEILAPTNPTPPVLLNPSVELGKLLPPPTPAITPAAVKASTKVKDAKSGTQTS